MIGKTGHTYKGTERQVGDNFIPIQRVNRIYACNDETYGGAIYKIKDFIDSNGETRIRRDKLANCPLCTMIDGYDEISIDKLDKEWYIDYTNKKYKTFIGD